MLMCSREGYFGVYFPICVTREINTKIKVKLFMINTQMKNDDKNDELHTSSPCLTRAF